MNKECREHFIRISEYLDGELDADLCKEIEAHLEQCPDCQNCLESLKRTIALCKDGARETIPVEAKERLRFMLRNCMEPNPL